MPFQEYMHQKNLLFEKIRGDLKTYIVKIFVGLILVIMYFLKNLSVLYDNMLWGPTTAAG